MIEVIMAVLAGLGVGVVCGRSEAGYQEANRKLWRAVSGAAFVLTLVYGSMNELWVFVGAALAGYAAGILERNFSSGANSSADVADLDMGEVS